MAVSATFDWKCQPQAEALQLKLLAQFLERSLFLSNLDKELHEQTSTRLFDWIDHLVIEQTPAILTELKACGFEVYLTKPQYTAFHHPGAQLPRLVVFRPGKMKSIGAAVKVESIAEFLLVRGMHAKIEGTPYSSYRRACVDTQEGVSCWVVERRSTLDMDPVMMPPEHIEKYLRAQEKWAARSRDLEDEESRMEETLTLAEEIVHMVGKDMAAWIVLGCERVYWQSRNRAAQIQKNRQDRLGMGWANHDHHTFRSSRKHFRKLIDLFKTFGFFCRERFYAGEEAGWGAQVMENSQTGLVLFLDVDLSPQEIQIDFAHSPLPELNHTGTIGLWCLLHGDSILKSGMHHLEAQFFFEDLTKDLEQHGVEMMLPFSDFTYLKQAFTKGEIWRVAPERVELILSKKLLSEDQAEKFLQEGALGSHLENLQRREGYKGFNQKNVSWIIKKTDPRAQSAQQPSR